jgi:hypothetical protein
MWFQKFVRYEFLEILAGIIGFILEIFKPIVTPIGEWMVYWVGFLLQYFPTGSLTVYIVIFAVLVVSAIIINTKWPGEKYIPVYTKDETPREVKTEDKSIEKQKIESLGEK